jgi:GT2 family glycosyltransferase
VDQLYSYDQQVSRDHLESVPVIAVILTYNRKALLCLCVESCLAQTLPPDRVFIFDNASTDGTREELRAKGYLNDPRISYFSVAKNVGPAAGFDELIRLAWQAGCQWVWIMDDDVIPSPTALQILLEAFAENFSFTEDVGFLASAIFSGDGLPNNVPEIEMRRPRGQDPVWGNLLSRGLVRIRLSTLCSVLIPRSTLTRCGSVNPDFRFAGLDIDFSLRITNVLPGYLVGKSVVTHLRHVTGSYSILTEVCPQRIKEFYYNYRNSVYLIRKYYSLKRTLGYILLAVTESSRALFVKEYPLLRARTIIIGIVSGIFFWTSDKPIGPPQLLPENKASDGVSGKLSGEPP